MLAVRLVKIAMVAATAVFALLVAVNNVVDYATNDAFVRHTLSMDTTIPGNALKERAIVSPTLWTIAYWLIIAAEAATGLLLTWATVRLATAVRARAETFNAAKSLMLVGAGFGFLLWFGGFMVVGGEWFAMWQSRSWNGQEAAFRFYMSLLAVAILVNQPDGELKG